MKDNMDEYIRMITLAAETGRVAYQAELGERYLWGNGVPKDVDRGLYWLYMAAENGDVETWLELGDIYRYGEIAGYRNYREALKWYGKAASKKNADAMEAIGRMYEKGRGVEKDIEYAEEWYRKAYEARKRNQEKK